MATAKTLLSIVGKSVKSAALRKLIAADGLKVTTEPDLEEGLPISQYFISKKGGYEISAEDGRVVGVFLYLVKEHGYNTFAESLPFEVPHEATKKEVRKTLGKPECSGRAFNDKILGPQGAWDRFAIDSLRIHFEYTNPGQQIKMITLMPEDAAP